ncbi:MAG: MgtC/SapB family protein [Velocimicrobium sp.]
MYQNFLYFIHSTNTVSIFIRLLLALICGGVIGYERARRGRPAGLRTHILVCIGATLTMLTNQYLYMEGLSTDVARMGAQVISGVGFIGAGTIMVTGQHKVTGLTTAASLWASACLGLTIGCGFYSAAILGLVSIWIVNYVLYRLDTPIHSNSQTSYYYIECSNVTAIRSMIIFLKADNIRVSDLELVQIPSEVFSTVGATLTLHTKQKMEHDELTLLLESINGIEFAEEI